MFWIVVILVSGLLTALAGFTLGGVPAAIFMGALGLLLAVAVHDIRKHRHAILAGTLLSGLGGLYFGGLELGIALALFAFLLLLAVHDFLMKKDVLLPIGLAIMLVCGLAGWHVTSAPTTATHGAVATVFSMIGFLVWVGIFDHYLQRQHTIRRNFPIIGWCRYGFELIGDELRQYWFMGNREEWPYNRITRRYLYRSGKGLNNNLGFGTEEPYREVGKLHLLPTAFPIPDKQMGTTLPQLVIGKKRRQPYVCPWPIGIAHMSWGALSEEAVRALSSGGKLANIHMGTGEGGLTPYHIEGVVRRVHFKVKFAYLRALAGYHALSLIPFVKRPQRPQPPKGEVLGGTRLIVEIGPAKFGFRRLITDPFTSPEQRGFRKMWSDELDIEKVKRVMASEQNIMLLVKGGQGAKPGQGGKLPKEKITPELAEWRGIPEGVDCYSPNAWDEFNDVPSLVAFIDMLQEATGKPVGFKTPVGTEDFIRDLAKHMKETGKGPDFLIIDGGEGGTGAAPVALADTVALPLFHAIPVVDNALREFGVRDDVVLIGAGQLAKGSDVIIAMALGCDMVDIGRAFLIGGLGCIMAMRCHTNRCPTGIATQDPLLRRGLDPEDKYVKVANYAMVLQREIIMLCKSLGVRTPWELSRRNLSVVSSPMVSTKLSDIYPYPDDGKRNPTLMPAPEPSPDSHDHAGPKLIKLEVRPARTRLTP